MRAFTGLTVSHLNFAGCFFRCVVSIGWEAVAAEGFGDRRAHFRFRRPLMRLIVWPLCGPPRLARRVIMLKYAVGAIVCSLSLTLCSDTLQGALAVAEGSCGFHRAARLRPTCCALPAPTCCQAPGCGRAPRFPRLRQPDARDSAGRRGAATAPAARRQASSTEILRWLPIPRMAIDSRIAVSHPIRLRLPAANGSPVNTPVVPRSNRFDANRKMLGIRY